MNIEQRTGALMATGKIRMGRRRLQEMVLTESLGQNMMILLADVDGFVAAVKNHPLFQNMDISFAGQGFEAAIGATQGTIQVFPDELPGPIAMGHFTLEQFEVLVASGEVLQIEEISKSALD